MKGNPYVAASVKRLAHANQKGKELGEFSYFRKTQSLGSCR